MGHFFIVEKTDVPGLHRLHWSGVAAGTRPLSTDSRTVRCHHVKYIDPKQTKADLFSYCLITLGHHSPRPIISQASQGDDKTPL